MSPPLERIQEQYSLRLVDRLIGMVPQRVWQCAGGLAMTAAVAAPMVPDIPAPAEHAPYTIVSMQDQYRLHDGNDACPSPPNDELAKNNEIAFGALRYTNAPNDELLQAATQSFDDLEVASKKLKYGKLPDNFQELLSDIQEDAPHIPLETYQKTFDEYLAQYGMTSRLTWDERFIHTTNVNKQIYEENQITPLSWDELEKNPFIKSAILHTIFALQQLPKSLLSYADVKTIVFGNIQAKNVAGRVEGQEVYIHIGNRTANNASRVPGDMDHEFGHKLGARPCNNQRDYRLEYLNRNFVYLGDKPSKQLIQHDSQFISLETIVNHATPAEDTIVATSPYGETRAREDTAEIFRYLLDSSLREDLTRYGHISDILNSKVVLLLSRLHKELPEVADYYLQAIRAAKFSQLLIDRQIAIRHQLPTNPDGTAAIVTRQDKIAQQTMGRFYDAIQQYKKLTDPSNTLQEH